jgi:hypothetical protein
MALAALVLASGARGEIVEDLLLMPTDMAASHHFLLNPASHKLKSLEGSAVAARGSKRAKLDQSAAGSFTFESSTNDDHVGVSLLADLGAGAGLGVSHQTLFRKTETGIEGATRDDSLELLKETQSAFKLIIELTEGLNAGMTMRYMYKDYQVLGSPFLNERLATHYKSSLIGYGAGASYDFKKGGIGYAYYPPLRGKTSILGEEYILVEPGEIVADAYFVANQSVTAGLLFKRWINEIDDRAAGTTADDDQTTISLYGLDPDQYLFQRQLLMAGLDYVASKQTALRVGVGREEAEFNFRDLARYNGIQVNQGGRTSNPIFQYYRARIAVRFSDKGVELNAGGGMFKRAYDFSQAMGGAKYEADGRELFASVGLKL